MSGGSFDYLYGWETERLMTCYGHEMLTSMRDELMRLGHLDAAAQTDAVLQTLITAEKLVDARRRAGLDDVWKAVEWARSGDWSDKDVAETVEKWRKGVSG